MKNLCFILSMVMSTMLLTAQSTFYNGDEIREYINAYYDVSGYNIQNIDHQTHSAIRYFDYLAGKRSKPELNLTNNGRSPGDHVLSTIIHNGRETAVNHHLTLRFDIMTFSVYMTSNENSYMGSMDFSWSEGHKVADIDVPEGIYDIMIQQYDFMNTQDLLYVFLHNLNINEDIDTTINLVETAINIIYFNGQDENNVILNSNDTTLLENDKYISVEFPAPFVFQNATGFESNFPKDYVKFSNVDPSYQISFGQCNVKFEKMYVLDLGTLSGIVANTTLENDPNDFKKMSAVFHESPSAEDDYLTFSYGIISRLRDDPYYWMNTSFGSEDANYPTQDKDTLHIFLSNVFQTSKRCNLVGGVAFWEIMPEWDAPKKQIKTKLFYINQEERIQFSWFHPYVHADYSVPENTVVDFGNTVPYINSFGVNTGNSIFNYSDIFGQSNEIRTLDNYTSMYFIKQGNDILHTDTLYNFNQPYSIPSSGPYAFWIEDYNFYVGEMQGSLIMQTNFNLPSDDPNPPMLTSFKILDESGSIRNTFHSDETAGIYLSAIDYSSGVVNDVTGAFLYFSKHEENTWTSVTLQEIPEYYDSIFLNGQFFIGDLTPVMTAFPDTSFLIDLRLTLLDASSNINRQTFSPAFKVTNTPVGVHQDETDQRKRQIEVFPNPLHSNSSLNIKLVDSIRQVRLYNALGKVVFEAGGFNKSSITLNLNETQSGIYILQCIDTEGNVHNKKVIIDK